MFDSFEKSLKLISRLDIKAIEHAFPTVIWDKKVGGGLFSYDIESGWKFFNDCPNDCCWKSIIDELPVQLEMLLQKNYCGYQTITFKKRTSTLRTSFGSLVIDAGNVVHKAPDGTIVPNDDWSGGIASKNNYYPTDVLIEKAKQFAFVWGMSQDELNAFADKLKDETIQVVGVYLNEVNGRYLLRPYLEDDDIWFSFVPTQNADPNRHLIGGLSFLLNNALQTCKGNGLRKIQSGMIVFTPSTVDVENGADAVSSVFVCVGEANDFKNRGMEILNGFSLITRSYGLAVERWLLALQTKKDFSEQSTRTAIGSIMSRNGSHNIGSHVLSALSHNVGTMPDDRVLYQYIQHRMDYIATATTEFPQWTTPTMFVGGLMKNFYAQKHLLDYISRSEGLRAYKFQERNLDDAARMNQHGTIRIFLRRLYELGNSKQDDKLPDEHRYLTYDLQGQARSIYYFFGEKDTMFRSREFSEQGRMQYEVSESGGTAKFLEYAGRFTPDWSQDVRIAIPGGIVGQHAFYTIIENVIRNAAKHGWAAKDNLREKDLEVYIDFVEDKNKGDVVFTIWDNVSDVFGVNRNTYWDILISFCGSFSMEEWSRILRCLTPLRLNAQSFELLTGDVVISEMYENLCRREMTSGKERDELDKEINHRVKDFIVRVFAVPLRNEEASNLETIIKEKKVFKDSCLTLPTVYRLQIILSLILKYRLSCVSNLVELQVVLDEVKFVRLMYVAWNQYCIDGRQARISRKYDLLGEALLERWHQFVSRPNEYMRLGQRGVVVRFCAYLVECGDISLFLPLHHDQQRKLTQRFIYSDGKLRKENWGLAEMKISAGYLGQRKTSEIGGLEEAGGDIIIPIAMPGVCRNADNPHNCLACSERDWNKMPCRTDENCPFAKHRFHLGYRFKIAKPKNVLVVLSKPLPEGLKDRFSGEGIDFAYADETRDKNGRLVEYKIKENQQASTPIKLSGYRYVVVPEWPSSKEEEAVVRSQLCFRCATHEEVVFRKSATNNGQGQEGNDKINLYELLSCEEDKRKHFLKELDDNGKKVGLELCKAVQSAWVRKLAKECGKIEGRAVKLIVNVEGNENGSERGLVTRKDLLRTMFVECYHTALIAFLKNPPGSLELSDTTSHLIALLSLIKVIPDKMVEPQQDYGHGDDYGAKEYIRAQLVAYCDLLKSHLHLSREFIDALKSIERYVEGAEGEGDAIIARKIEDIEKDFEKSIARRLFRGKQDEDAKVRQSCEELIAFLRKVDKVDLDGWLDAFHGRSDKYKFPKRKDAYLPGTHTFDDNLKAIVNACSVPEEDEFNALVESLNSMFLASDVYLRKYEERIATLPEAYKHDGSEQAAKTTYGTKTEDVQDITESLIGRKLEKESDCVVVKYSRHDHAMPRNGVYAEALSGSQSYLNALSRLVCASGMDKSGERYAAVARLLENAFLRILIIDERVMNFVNERRSDRMIETFINMGIWVADVDKKGAPEASSSVRDKLYQFHYGSLSEPNEKPDVHEPAPESVPSVAVDFKPSTQASNEVPELAENSSAICVDIDKDQFDVLIIHQGIIDKWWEQYKHDKENVSKILTDLRRSIPRVVVTTGRGRPDNIPDHEKVLPFSVIESSLFRRYPEKLILVNTIMNLLPYGKEGEEK